MGDFDFFFGFLAIILGLIIAEVAVKFADAVDRHPRRHIGLLSPLLALFVLLDVTSLCLWAWGARGFIQVSWASVYSALAIALCYFLAASLVFPRGGGDEMRVSTTIIGRESGWYSAVSSLRMRFSLWRR